MSAVGVDYCVKRNLLRATDHGICFKLLQVENHCVFLVKGYVFIISVDFGPYSHYIFIASVVNHDGTTYTLPFIATTYWEILCAPNTVRPK